MNQSSVTEVHCWLIENPLFPWANVRGEGLWWRCEEHVVRNGNPGIVGYWVKAEQ